MPSKFAHVNGITLHYLDHPGGGQTILLLPGLSANAHEFDGLIAAGLAPRFRVIAVDLRGRGRSDAPDSGYGMADHAADVLALLDHLGLERVVLGGHSFGSLLTLWIASRHSERVTRAVVIDGAVHMHPEVRRLIQPSLDRLDRVLPSEEAYLEAMRAAPHLVGAWDEQLEGYFRAEIERLEDGTARSRTSARAIAQALDGTFAEPWADLARAVRCPALLLNATEPYGTPGTPPVVPAENALATAGLIPSCRYAEVPGNHFTMVFGANAATIVGEMSAFVEAPGQLQGHEYSVLFRNDAGERRYELRVPPTTPTVGSSLIVMLHGCTQDAADFAAGTRMNEAGAQTGQLILWPQQPASANGLKCWNWFLPAHQAHGAGEPAILAGMIRDVVERHDVDPRHVFLAGVSAGAAMATVMTVAYPELFAAVALHSGVPWGSASGVIEALGLMAGGESDPVALGHLAFGAMGPSARATPAFVLHGAADTVVHPTNGVRLAQQFAIIGRLAAGESVTTMPTPSRERIHSEPGRYDAVVATYEAADGRLLVEEWRVDVLGHAWSGGSPAGTFTDERGPDATAAIARFFALPHGPVPGQAGADAPLAKARTAAGSIS